MSKIDKRGIILITQPKPAAFVLSASASVHGWLVLRPTCIWFHTDRLYGVSMVVSAACFWLADKFWGLCLACFLLVDWFNGLPGVCFWYILWSTLCRLHNWLILHLFTYLFQAWAISDGNCCPNTLEIQGRHTCALVFGCTRTQA